MQNDLITIYNLPRTLLKNVISFLKWYRLRNGSNHNMIHTLIKDYFLRKKNLYIKTVAFGEMFLKNLKIIKILIKMEICTKLKNIFLRI